MVFNLEIWKEKTAASLKTIGRWLEERKNKEGPLLLYGYLSSLSLAPLVMAASSGDPMPVFMALGGVFGGVGGNLLANKVQEWANQAQRLDQAELSRLVVEQLSQNEALRAEIDQVLQKLEVIPQAQLNLDQAQQAWFVQTLKTELDQLGNLARFEANLSGQGALAQGAGARASYAGQGGAAIAGDIHGNLTIVQGRAEADPSSLRQAYLNRLLERAGYLSLAGIDPKAAGVQTETRLDLSAVYTALLTLSTEQPERPGRAGGPERDLRRLPALAHLNQHSRLVLLGDPGSGKSTFVDFVTMCLAGEGVGHPQANLNLLTAPLPDDEGQDQAEGQPWRHGALLPVPVILRDFAARGLPPVGERATAQHL